MATRPPKNMPTDHPDRPRFFGCGLRQPAPPTSSCCPHIRVFNAEARRRRDAESSFRSLIVRRGPGRQTARDRWAGAPLRKHAFVVMSRPAACALEERRSRLSLSSKNQWELSSPRHKKVRARRNRHAIGVSAGGATMRDERSRSERMIASPVAGDREIAGVSAGHSRRCRSSSAMNPSCLCVFVFATRVGGLPSAPICVICGFLAMGVRPALRLCAFASLRFFLSVFLLCVSVSLWLSSFRWAGGHSEFRIPNSEFL